MTQQQQQELNALADKLNHAADEYKPWKDFYDKIYSDNITYGEQMKMMHTKKWLDVWGELTPERQVQCTDFNTPWDILRQMKEQKEEAYDAAYGAYHDKHFEYCGWDAL